MKWFIAFFLFLVLWTAGLCLAQGYNPIYDSKGSYWIYSPVTDSANNIGPTSATIFGSNERIKSNKQEPTATRKNVVNYMVWWEDVSPLPEARDSTLGMTINLTGLTPETTYMFTHVIYVRANNGSTDRYEAVSSSFTTPAIDSIPTQFAFTDVINAEISTVYQDSVIVSGINSPATIIIETAWGNPEYRVGALGTWISQGYLTPQYVNDGDTVYIRNMSSNFYRTESDPATLTIGGVYDAWTITTRSIVTYLVTADEKYVVSDNDKYITVEQGD